MLDRNQLKAQGLRYAKSMQMVFKTISVFSADHAAAQAPITQSFQALNTLLKETRQFTIGFVDNRIMINNILTTEKGIDQLETEFLKRGIGAVTFEAGMTQAAYKRAMSVVTVKPQVIEEYGGLLPYLQQNQMDWVRVFPAGKNQARNEKGDTILETDSESFLLQKAFSEMRPSGGGFDAILAQATMMGGVAGSGPAGPGGGLGPGGGGGYGPGTGGGPGDGSGGSGPGPGPGGGMIGGIPAQDWTGGPRDILSLVDSRLEQMATESDDGANSYVELAKVLRSVRPEFVVSAFSPQKQEELKGSTQDRVATELLEDRAVQWAAQRLTTAPTGTDAVIVEEQVVKVLIRSLEATQMSERLAQKLHSLVKQYSIPQSTVDRIQDELKWATMTPKQRHAYLLGVPHFNVTEFKRLLELIREFIRQSNFEDATALGNHYLGILDAAHTDIEIQEISRLPELLKSMHAVRTSFWPNACTKLLAVMSRDTFNHFSHVQIVNALVALSKSVAVFEDFDMVEMVGQAMERVLATDMFVHATCCGEALRNLMPATSADRLLEIYLENKESAKHLKSAAMLLRWQEEAGIDKVFQALEEEKNTANRLALLRLITRIGPLAVEAARKRLNDERWFVVRNACKLLGELKDPQLLKALAPILRHSNEKVQHAALRTIIESRLPARGMVIADALPQLHGHLVEEALADLAFVKDPGTLPFLETFILGHAQGSQAHLAQAVQVVGNIPDDRAQRLLGNIMADARIGIAVRREAMATLARTKSGLSLSLMGGFVTRFKDNTDDPLVMECQRILKPGG